MKNQSTSGDRLQWWRMNTLISWAGAAFFLATLAARADLTSDYRDKIRPLFKKHCFECHGTEKKKGDIDLERVKEFDQVKAEAELWQNVLEKVQAYEMPPKGKHEFSFSDWQLAMAWLRALPKTEKVDCDQIASDRNANFYKGYVMSRRLNRAEYANTVRDLFGLIIPLEDLLPADGGGGEGFDTTGSALFTSALHIENYLAATDRILEAVLPESNSRLSKERQAARAAILGQSTPPKREARQQAVSILDHWIPKLFRRQIEAGEAERYLAMFDRAWQRGDGYAASVRLMFKSLLLSPHFIFLVEPESEERGVQPLASFQLASRISYFLWSSAPDEALMALAKSDQLKDPNIYREQVHRLLADPKAKALGERFALQWLEIERLEEVHPDRKQFPEFDKKLKHSMEQEVIEFVNHIFANDRSLLELIDSDYTFVNQRLAALYGLPGVQGEALQQVKLADKQRGGVTGFAAVHTLTSFPFRTSPVLRGRWMLETLLGDKVPPPPPNVPALETSGSESKPTSIRAQLELHRKQADCAACHNKMDPLGFGMENFDVLGRWRESEQGLAIDASGTLPSGQTFRGPEGLKLVLMARKDDIIKQVARKLTGYAYGRELNHFDNCVIERALTALKNNHYRSSILVEEIALSFPFRHRFYPKKDAE